MLRGPLSRPPQHEVQLYTIMPVQAGIPLLVETRSGTPAVAGVTVAGML